MNRADIQTLIARHDLAALKKFGQNFLVDETIVDGIVRAAGVTKDDVILEIGPGPGTLTRALAENAGHVVAVEIDLGLVALLRETLADCDNVTVIEGDILEQDLASLAETHAHGAPLKVVANLPYYITTPILMRLLETGAADGNAPVQEITVMVQDEVATRMQAQPGKKDYGALSLAVQYYATCEKVLRVPPQSFYPAPKVESAVVHLTRHAKKPVNVSDEAALFRLIRAAFNQRRKTFVNAVSEQWTTVFPAQSALSRDEVKTLLREALSSAYAEETARAETLSLTQFAQICEAVQNSSHFPKSMLQ